MKRVLSFLLSLSIIMSSITVVYANNEDDQTMYEGENNYTATKISHPNNGVKEVDGLIENNGVNDRGQSYSWSAIGYHDYVYVGTCFGAIYQTLQIIAAQNNLSFDVVKSGIDTLFNGTLYTGDKNQEYTANRSVLVKINVSTSKTDIVVEPAAIGGYRAATEFNGKLYFAVSARQPYLLEINPQTDESKIVYRSQMPTPGSFVSTGIRGLTVYQGQLVATMIGDSGAYLVASKNPSLGEDSFETIGTQEDFLDYPAYHYNDSIFGGAIWDIIEYNNKLYVTVVTGKNGEKSAFALFSGCPDENGKWKYELIAGDEDDGAKYPYGLGSNRSGAANLIVHDEYLYIGGYNDPMIALPAALNMDFKPIYQDLSSPVCLWRIDKNNKIEMVSGDANDVFPKGPIGNMKAGFGSNLNQYVWRMESYENKLYVGTFDIGSLAYPLMQFTNGDVLRMSKEEWQSQIEYIKVLLEVLGNKEKSLVTYELKDIDDKNKLTNNLTLMKDIMEDMDADFDVASNPNKRAGLNDRKVFYEMLKKLIIIYNEVKEKLPNELITVLDKVLNQDNLNNFRFFIETCSYLSKGERGFDLLVSDNGVDFKVITRNGFGDPYNHGLRVFAITDSGLCIGSANPFMGTQVWKLTDNNEKSINDAHLLSEKGKYDVNSKSDLEIKINYNGNTLNDIQCNGISLQRNKDYYVDDDQVRLAHEFLSSLTIGEYEINFKFSAGNKAKYLLTITDKKNSEDISTNNLSFVDDKTKKSVNNVVTGDQTMLIVPTLMLFSGFGGIILFKNNKRRERKNAIK